MKIKLNKKKSKTSVNIDYSLATNLVGDKRLLPTEPIMDLVDEYEEYVNERSASTQVRLTCSVNTICSNVLFNNISEIVKDEGSDDVIVYNCEGYSNKDIYGSDNKFMPNGSNGTSAERLHIATQDTQLSRPSIGFKYHCGLDIFNNHTLRCDTFKSIAPPNKEAKNVFNTLADLNRDFCGTQLQYYKQDVSKSGAKEAHVYLADEISSFKDTVSLKLIEENGWFGFKNVTKFPMYKWDDDNKWNKSKPTEKYDYFSTINYYKGCDFVDLSPERDLFSFVPKFNKYKNRIEKNWNYCLTYPSSSTTDISFIDPITNGLKAIYYDDGIRASNGKTAIKIYSVSQHGLSEGNFVNIYINGVMKMENAEVIEVEDLYTFIIYANGNVLSHNWLYLEKNTDEYIVDGKTYTLEDGKIVYTSEEEKSVYYVVNKTKVNIDDEAQNLTFKRVVNSSECDYYVRIFSRLPNWKMSDREHSEYELYKEGSTLIHRYNNIENEFESHVGQLAFSRNIYGDKVGEVVFTDSIDIANLRDNLGRPLSTLYLTIVKNNRGYREWYGKNLQAVEPKNDDVEYSHAFGKISCAFRLSSESLVDETYQNIVKINGVSSSESGLSITTLNERNADLNEYLEQDEIEYNALNNPSYEGDRNFYGDLCCYNGTLIDEQIIQQVEFRFNTAQREVTDKYASYTSYGFNELRYDEITRDDYDGEFEIETKSLTNMVGIKEGYCYLPHYEIPIRTFSDNLNSAYPIFYKMKNMVLTDEDTQLYTIKLWNYHSLTKGRKFYVYDKESGVRYEGEVQENLAPTKFTATLKLMNDNQKLGNFIRIEFETTEEDIYKLIQDVTAFTYCMIDGELKNLQNTYSLSKGEHVMELGFEGNYVKWHSLDNGCFSGCSSAKYHLSGSELKVSPYTFDKGTVGSGTTVPKSDSQLVQSLTYAVKPLSKYKLFMKNDEEIPPYAIFINDGSCRYYWRTILQNGFNNDNEEETYPFTNGHIYINKNINLFLKRQGCEGDLCNPYYPYAIDFNEISDKKQNEYINEEDIVC